MHFFRIFTQFNQFLVNVYDVIIPKQQCDITLQSLCKYILLISTATSVNALKPLNIICFQFRLQLARWFSLLCSTPWVRPIAACHKSVNAPSHLFIVYLALAFFLKSASVHCECLGYDKGQTIVLVVCRALAQNK